MCYYPQAADPGLRWCEVPVIDYCFHRWGDAIEDGPVQPEPWPGLALVAESAPKTIGRLMAARPQFNRLGLVAAAKQFVKQHFDVRRQPRASLLLPRYNTGTVSHKPIDPILEGVRAGPLNIWV